MKDYKLLRIWEVIYPIGIYFVVTNVVMFVLNLIHTMTNVNYMIYQIIATVIAFPFVYAFYRKEDGGKMANLPRTILFAAAAGLFGVVLNNLIGYTGLKETSQSYQEVSVAFYGSSLALEILGTCIIIPFLEELLYRGIVYQRLKTFLGVKTAIVLSAVIFGAMHFNLVQFLYATAVGLLLAVIMEQEGLGAAMAAHMVTNLVSVLRSETKLFHFMDASMTGSVICTVVESVLIVVLLVLAFRSGKEK